MIFCICCLPKLSNPRRLLSQTAREEKPCLPCPMSSISHCSFAISMIRCLSSYCFAICLPTLKLNIWKNDSGTDLSNIFYRSKWDVSSDVLQQQQQWDSNNKRYTLSWNQLWPLCGEWTRVQHYLVVTLMRISIASRWKDFSTSQVLQDRHLAV